MTASAIREDELVSAAARAQRQLELLQATLNRAVKSVRLYQEKLAVEGREPGRVKSLEDLAKLPFTRREDFSEHYPYGMFAAPLRDIVRIHTAPGTGLAPTVTGYTRNDLFTWREILSRALHAAGVNETDVFQICFDSGLANWGRDYKDGAEDLGASVIPLTSLSLEKQRMVLSDYRTTVLVTSPSLADKLAAKLASAGAANASLALKTLILAGEPVSARMRENLENAFSATAWVHYGLSEAPGPAVAFECHAHEGLHVSEDHFYPEIVDPETGRPLEAGKPGELVLTTLTARAFPLIRFRTGDRAKFITETCPCGRTFRRISWLFERTDDARLIRGVKVSESQIMAHAKKALGHEPSDYRLRPGNRDEPFGLELSIPVDDSLFSDEIKVLERHAKSLEAALNQELGIPVKVRLTERMALSGATGRWINENA